MMLQVISNGRDGGSVTVLRCQQDSRTLSAESSAQLTGTTGCLQQLHADFKAKQREATPHNKTSTVTSMMTLQEHSAFGIKEAIDDVHAEQIGTMQSFSTLLWNRGHGSHCAVEMPDCMQSVRMRMRTINSFSSASQPLGTPLWPESADM